MFKKILPEVTFNPQFQKLWWAQILASIAFNTLIYVMIIRIAEQTSSNTSVSLFIVSFSIPALIFGLFAGVWVDRIERRWLIIATNVSRTLLVPIFYLAASFGIIYLYPLAIVMSIVTQFFIPAEARKLASLVKHRQLHQANSLFTLTLYFSFILGPLAAGPALKYLGMGRVFIILFIIFAGSSILAYLLPKDNPDKDFPERLSVKSELLDVFQHIRGSSIVWGGLALLTFSQTLIATMIAIGPGYVRSVLGASVEDTSLLMLAPAAVGMILGSLVISRLSHKTASGRLVIYGVFGAGLALLALGGISFLDQNVFNLALVALPVVFLLGAFNALAIIPSQTAVQVHTPEYLRGRVYGVLATMINGASFLPVLFAGILADTLGVATFFIILGIAVFISGFYIFDKFKAPLSKI